MVKHVYETKADAAPEILYRAKSDVGSWPEWDGELETVRIDGPAVEGAKFVLRPKGGPNVPMRVTEARPPSVFEDVADLPLARMRTRHAYASDGAGGTAIRIEIETTGLLAWVWDRLVARKEAAGLPESTQRFVSFARSRA